MSWTGLLNGERGRLHLGGCVDVEVYHWAEMADTVVNPPHRHTYFEVCWVEDGHGVFVVDGRSRPIGPGSLLFARPGVRHQIISNQAPGIRLAWVAFGLRLPGNAGGDGLNGLFAAFARGQSMATDADGRVAALWSALRRVAGSAPLPGDVEAAGGVAAALLIALAQAGSGPLQPLPQAPDGGAGAVRQALRYVQDNADRAVRVDEMARHVHLSPRQLTRLFDVHVGQSPAAYVAHARLDRAVALLLRTDLPVKQVSAEAGFGDVAQFTRVFSRRYGAPPARFRRDAELGPALARGRSDGRNRQAGDRSAQ
jgi:AraC-like DNA-binding protein